MKRLLMVLTATVALAGIARADAAMPRAMAACYHKKAGDPCATDDEPHPQFDGVCVMKSWGTLMCEPKEDKKRPKNERATLGAVLFAISAGSLGESSDGSEPTLSWTREQLENP